MAAIIITPEDLQDFKKELLEEIKELLAQKQSAPARKWLKSHEVTKLLTISPGTLYHLRVKGVLPFSKIGSVFFYDYDDVQKMIEDNKNNRDFPTRKHNPWRNV
jgi:hypothetical protein